MVLITGNMLLDKIYCMPKDSVSLKVSPKILSRIKLHRKLGFGKKIRKKIYKLKFRENDQKKLLKQILAQIFRISETGFLYERLHVQLATYFRKSNRIVSESS